MRSTPHPGIQLTRSISESLGSGGSRLVNARESLERIRQRHEDLADRMTAAEALDKELGHRALERKLADAGIGGEADRQRQVMARIRARQLALQGGKAAE
jgi:phage shock protein A